MDESKRVPEEAPKRTVVDVGHAVAKLGLSQVPVVGAPAAAWFEFLVSPGVERRRTAWMEEIAASVNELRDSIKNLELLPDDEGFVTTLIEASNTALRTHQEEKLEALRNAVINTVLKRETDDDLRTIFLALVDRFTPWHLRILKFFDDPRIGIEQAGLDPSDFEHPVASDGETLLAVFPDLKDRSDFISLLVSELSAAGLFNVNKLGLSMSGRDALARRSTNLGRRFLAFISTAPS